MAFADDVDAEEARQLVEDEGLEIEAFHATSPPRVQVRVPRGDECATMLRLSDHPRIAYTSLVILIYAR